LDIKALDELENKVQALITALESVRSENERMKQELNDTSSTHAVMEAENSRLKQELDELKSSTFDQKSRLEAVTERIQGLLSRLDTVS
jgi:FtsZ-binding cell division protein ZapB